MKVITTGSNPKVESIKVSNFPKGLQGKAAKQFLYNQLVDPDQNSLEKKDIYSKIQSMDIEPYIVPVFNEHDPNAEYLLSLEISNMLQASSYEVYDLHYVYGLIHKQN